jgi:molecular chaperone HscA
LIEATQTALQTDGDLLSVDERTVVEALQRRLAECAAGDDAATIKSASDDLARGTEEFEARRMDRNVRAALAGRRIDDVVAG